MRYEMMFPDQIQKAIAARWPVVLPLGVLEYHGAHCVCGVDTLLVVRAVEALEQDMDLVILPPFHYGAASYAVAPPEGKGTVHIGPEVLTPFAKALFQNLLRIGFRNVHAVVHHQSEKFAAGMPTDLSFKLAAREAIFEFLERERGEGWWGDEKMADYYARHGAGSDPFSWIRVHPFMSESAQAKWPIDHAGLQETSLMLAFCPEGVDLRRLDDAPWFAASAKQASLEYGNAAKACILADLKKALTS